MKLVEFIGEEEFTRIEYIFLLTKKVERKMNKGKFFYENQVSRYVMKKVELYFNDSTLDEGAKNIYKHEMYNTVMYRLKPIFEQRNVLRAV